MQSVTYFLLGHLVPANVRQPLTLLGLSKTCRAAGTDAGTALMAVDASSAVPLSVPVSVDAN